MCFVYLIKLEIKYYEVIMRKFDLYYETAEERRYRQISWKMYKYMKYNPISMKTAEYFDVYKRLHVFFNKRNIVMSGGLENGLMLTELFASGENKSVTEEELTNAGNALEEYIKLFESNSHLLVLPNAKNEK
jgi:hypothetical protein